MAAGAATGSGADAVHRRLATELGLSKSVVFAVFGSKEELQVVAIKAAHEIFVEQVVTPALAVEPVSIGCGGCASAGWRTRTTGTSLRALRAIARLAGEAKQLGHLDSGIEVAQLSFRSSYSLLHGGNASAS